MRFTRFFVSDFGILHEQGVDPLEGDLVLFVGENESGKTTLLHFFRYALFGVPDRRGSRNLYEPLRGRIRQGRLAFTTRDGSDYLLEMHDRRVLLNGDAGGNVSVLLGHLDQGCYESIFAMGLSDLQGTKILREETVQGRLFAAGAGLGVASLPGLMERLSEKQRGFYRFGRGRGTGGKVNELLESLRSVEEKLRGLAEQEGRFWDLRDEEERLQQQVARETEESGEIRKRLSRLLLLEKIRRPWTERKLAKEKLARITGGASFPERGIERYEALVQEAEVLQASCREGRERVSRLEDREALLRERHAWVILEHREEVESLREERGRFQELLASEARLEAEIRKDERRHAEHLAELGDGWNDARLFRVDLSLPAVQEAQRFDVSLRDGRERRRLAEQNFRQAREDVEEAEAVLAVKRERFAEVSLPEDLDEELLDERKEALSRLRVFCSRRDRIAEAVRLARENRDRLRVELANLEQDTPGRYALFSLWAPVSVLIGAFALAFLWFLRRDPMVIVLSVVGFALAPLFYALAKRQGAADEELQRKWKTQTERKRAEVAEAEAHTTEQETLAEGIREQICVVADGSGLPSPDDAERLEALVLLVEEEEALLETYDAARVASEDAGSACERALGRMRKADEEVHAAGKLLEDEEWRWREWLRERGFESRLEPGGFPEFVAKADACRAETARLSEARATLATVRTDLESIRNRLTACLCACGLPSPESPDVSSLDLLVRAGNEVREAARELDALREQSMEERAALHSCEERLEGKRNEVARLFVLAGAADEDSFRACAASAAQRLELGRLVEEAEKVLVSLGGSLDALASLEEEMTAFPLDLEQERVLLEQRVAALEDSCAGAHRRAGEVAAELQRMAHDENVSELRQERQTIVASLREAVKEWLAVVLCRRSLDEARSIHERERQPGVIRDADRFLRTLTGNRHALRLRDTSEGGAVELEECATGARRGEDAWSSGLADQAYLALRLGMARQFGLRTEPLPLILDDLLVRFDEKRRLGAARVLLEIAREHQVLLFSCHRVTREIFSALLTEAKDADSPVAGVEGGASGRAVRVSCFTLSEGEIREASLSPAEGSLLEGGMA